MGPRDSLSPPPIHPPDNLTSRGYNVLNTAHVFVYNCKNDRKKEGNVLFNDALNTFLFTLIIMVSEI